MYCAPYWFTQLFLSTQPLILSNMTHQLLLVTSLCTWCRPALWPAPRAKPVCFTRIKGMPWSRTAVVSVYIYRNCIERLIIVTQDAPPPPQVYHNRFTFLDRNELCIFWIIALAVWMRQAWLSSIKVTFNSTQALCKRCAKYSTRLCAKYSIQLFN